jgi:hypothetical protein
MGELINTSYDFCFQFFSAAYKNVRIGRHSRAMRNFLSRFEENEISLATGWCMKESNRCMKNF